MCRDMNAQLSRFIDAVTQSKVLTGIQKKELLDHPDVLPEAYRARIIDILQSYDDRARVREKTVKGSIEEAQMRFAQELDAEDVPIEEKRELLEKSMNIVGAVTKMTPTS